MTQLCTPWEYWVIQAIDGINSWTDPRVLNLANRSFSFNLEFVVFSPQNQATNKGWLPTTKNHHLHWQVFSLHKTFPCGSNSDFPTYTCKRLRNPMLRVSHIEIQSVVASNNPSIFEIAKRDRSVRIVQLRDKRLMWCTDVWGSLSC